MKNIKKLFLYGFLLWLIPFAISALIFSIRDANRALFESIMAVVVVSCVVGLGVLYLQKDTEVTIKDGMVLGLVWLVVSLVLDFIMFIQGPIKMTTEQYIADIGITYLVIPIITVGLSLVPVNKKKETENPVK